MTSRPVFRITASGTWRANIRRFGGITESDRGAQSYKDRFEMPLTCAVLGCSNRGNREEGKRYFRIPIEVSHKGAKITKKRREEWLKNLSLSSSGVQSDNARVFAVITSLNVCSDSNSF